jgi:hypothetical protein
MYGLLLTLNVYNDFIYTEQHLSFLFLVYHISPLEGQIFVPFVGGVRTANSRSKLNPKCKAVIF